MLILLIQKLLGILSYSGVGFVGLISCFLHVHPSGASVDYIWSYLHQLGVSTRTSELEDLMERLSVLFSLEMTGVGATIEKKWQFLGYRSALGMSFLAM